MRRLLRRYGELDTRLKSENLFRSFRFEIVLCSLLAILYALLTEAAIAGITWLIYRMLDPSGARNTAAVPQGTSPSGDMAAGQPFQNLVRYPVTESSPDPEALIGIAAFLTAAGIILFVIYFMLLTRKFSVYLTEIGSGIDRISTGDFESRIQVRSGDELGLIAQRLNSMADEIRRLMETERNTENTKNELITSVAHDLRTPLTSILGYLDLASADSIDEATRQKYLSIAYSKSKRLEKLIEDLFSFTKLTSGEIKLNVGSIDLVKMMEQLLDEFYPSFQDNHLECEFVTSAPSIVIEADGDQLARAFANLIGNAVKYGAAGKNIKIELQAEADRVRIAVTNFGELIPPKDMAYIFNRFYRVENSRSSETGGSGLGLAIVRSIVELHHGSIEGKSDFDGTVFTVVLPIKAEEQGR